MNLYAESSAVLCWLLGDKDADRVRPAILSAEITVASELTLVECERVLIRNVALGQLSETEAAGLLAQLTETAGGWQVIPIDAEILERVRHPFPAEPVRTLDAIHLASALVARRAMPELAMLSLDERIRRCGRQLGLPALPE